MHLCSFRRYTAPKHLYTVQVQVDTLLLFLGSLHAISYEYCTYSEAKLCMIKKKTKKKLGLLRVYVRVESDVNQCISFVRFILCVQSE